MGLRFLTCILALLKDNYDDLKFILEEEKNALNYYFFFKEYSISSLLWKFNRKESLQQNVFLVMNFSEENFFVTKRYHIVTKFIFCHYL